MQKKHLFIGLSLIPLLVALIGFIALLNSPSLGIEFEPKDGKWFIASVRSGSPAEKLRGDIGGEVVSIGGLTVERYSLLKAWNEPPSEGPFRQWIGAQRYLSEHVRPGIPLSLNIRNTDGNISEMTVTPARTTFLEVLKSVWANFLSAAVSLLIALFVAVKKPEDKKARVFFSFVFCLSMIVFSFISWSHRDISLETWMFGLLFGIELIFLNFIPISFFHFSLVFPVEKRIARNRLFLTALYAAPVMALLLSYIGEDLFFFVPGRLVLFPFMGGFFGGVAVMAVTYFRLPSTEEKAQIKWVFWAASVALLSMLLLAYVPMLAMNVSFMSSDLYLFTDVLIPLSMAFSIMKYRLMDIDALFDNTLTYAITLGGLALIDIGATTSLMSFKVLYLTEPVATVISTWLIILAYVPMRNRVKKVIKRVLKREVYDLNEISVRLNKQLLSAQAIPDIIAKAEAIIDEALHPRGIETVLFDMQSSPFPSSPPVKGGETFNNSPLPLWERVRVRGNYIREPRQLSSLFSSDDLPADYSGGVVVPLMASSGSLGCFVLGNKHSDRFYSSEDMKLLTTVAGQTALAVENIRSREETFKREAEARAEKERISREMHDGIGGILANINILLESASRAAGPGERERALSAISGLSKEGISEIRQFMQGLDDRDIIWSSFVADLKRHAGNALEPHGIALSFNAAIEIPDERPRLFLWLNVLRIYKEALTNVIKHSQAKKVDIGINVNKECLDLRIHDAGIGFKGGDGGGRGISNMKTRAEDLGGRLAMTSDKGTALHLSIPIKYHEVGMGKGTN